MQRPNTRALKYRFVIRTRDEQYNALCGLSKYFWVVDLWRSNFRPTYCIISNGQCRIGVERATYWVFRSHPEVSLGMVFKLSREAAKKDGLL